MLTEVKDHAIPSETTTEESRGVSSKKKTKSSAKHNSRKKSKSPTRNNKCNSNRKERDDTTNEETTKSKIVEHFESSINPADLIDEKRHKSNKKLSKAKKKHKDEADNDNTVEPDSKAPRSPTDGKKSSKAKSSKSSKKSKKALGEKKHKSTKRDKRRFSLESIPEFISISLKKVKDFCQDGNVEDDGFTETVHSSIGDASISTVATSNDDIDPSASAPASDPSKQEYADERPQKYDSAFFTAIYVFVIIYILIAGWIVPAIKRTIEEKYWPRCIWFLLLPLAFGMMLFPFKLVIFNVCCLFGSYRNIDVNSTTHSAKKPPVPKVLPKVLVQMPVYKESFEETIKPSIDDIRECIMYYRARGGQAGMFINDDGLQLISEEDRQQRIAYYNQHRIAYIARPPPKVLSRRGLFKKASNMNFCLNFALEVDQAEKALGLTKQEAIQHVIDSRSYPVLAGGPIGMEQVKNILLVDSDTRVPEACLFDTVGEFEICTNLGFAQHTISVLRVEDTYWEDWLADFTDKLYNLYIALGTSNGDPPPLVGHNATLSWEAMKDVSWFDNEANYQCFWSESHVSEDFDMSLRLQSANYCGRYIMYTGTGFKEGVSVQVFDEIIKLKKYAYGTGEMLFNKIKDWPRNGILSPIAKAYLSSSVRIDAKINMFAYLFTYIAMAWGVLFIPLTLYLSVLSDKEKHMQQNAFEVLCGCVLAFGIIGNITTVLLQFLRKRNSIIMEAARQAWFAPIVSLFFSGLLYHIFNGLLRYLLDMKAEWGATTKELGEMEYKLSRFPAQAWGTIKRFWFMYVLLLVFSSSLAVLYLLAPSWLDWNGIAMSPFMVMIVAHSTMPMLLDFTTMYCLWIPFKNAFIKRNGNEPQNGDPPVIEVEIGTSRLHEDRAPAQDQQEV